MPNTTEIRILPVADLFIEEFSGPIITKLASYQKNLVVEKYLQGSDKAVYLTQRPSFDLDIDASATVVKTKGRGIYYWSKADKTYIVNDDTMYYDNYSSAMSGDSITSGQGRVYLDEVGNYLVLIDPDGDDGFYVNSASDTTLTNIGEDDADFPTSLAHGVAQLDGYIFVLDTDGVIWNSDLDDPTSWTATNFITAERENDPGVYLAKHHNDIVVFGGRSTEFFYDTGSASGSPLQRRSDIYYNYGCLEAESVFEEGDRIFLLGTSPHGAVGVYMLEKYQLTKISSDSFDRYLNQVIILDGAKVLGSGFAAGDHTYYLLTVYSEVDDSRTYHYTFVFDVGSGTWTFWDTSLDEWSEFNENAFPVIAWGERSGGSIYNQNGILSNGDVITYTLTSIPIDRAFGQRYFEEGYISEGYFLTTTDNGTNISTEIKISHNDLDTHDLKFMRSFEIAGDYLSDANTATIRFYDDDHNTEDFSRTVRLDRRMKTMGLGSFNRRTFQVEYAENERIRWEAFEVTVDKAKI